MNNETQLTKWREEFAYAEGFAFESAKELENIINRRFPRTFDGYCLAKQETEQAFKEVRKQTLQETLAICNGALSFPDSKNYISDKIKELLNEQ